MDYRIPVLGEVRGASSWPSGIPAVWGDDQDFNWGFGPVPQWSDDSDESYGTAIKHGYVDTSNTGLLAPLFCDMTPVTGLPPLISSLTVRIRARIRPSSPPELTAWVGPPHPDLTEVIVGIYGATGPDGMYELAAYSRPVNNEVQDSSFFHVPQSWESTWHTAVLPAYRWDWREPVYNEATDSWEPGPNLLPGAREHLSQTLQAGAQIRITPGSNDESDTTYYETWLDVYEVQIVAHSPSLKAQPSGSRRAFKGVRR